MQHLHALLVLQDGTQFWGKAIGAAGSSIGEVVFNTSMTGYQEILTDPSYAQQIVTLTYPHIGNVGINSNDEEHAEIYTKGLIVRDLSPIASNFRHQECLEHYLQRKNIVAIADIDTRKLTRILREKGAQHGCIMTCDKPYQSEIISQALHAAKQFTGLSGVDLAQEVTCQTPYSWSQGTFNLSTNNYSTYIPSQLPYHVVAYDFGIKRNILRQLSELGCAVTVVPAKTPAQAVFDLQPDGIFLSNGPGDPAPCNYAITAIQQLLQTNIPIFGICLGHQLLALALGAKTVKMKFGHHGGNHPVKDISNNTVMITAQNHGFSVDEATLPADVRATHYSLFDHSLQGIHHMTKPAFSFQGHPEASPGPHDAAPLFDHFIELIQHYIYIRGN